MSTAVATTDWDTALKAAQDALAAHNFAEAKLQAAIARIATLRIMKSASSKGGGGGGFEAEQHEGRDWQDVLAMIEQVEIAIQSATASSRLVRTRTNFG